MDVDIIDAHAHLAFPQPLFEGHEAAAEDLVSQMETTSVDLAVVLALATEKGNLKATKKYNEFIADTAKEFCDQFTGVGSVHPGDAKKAVEELDRFCDLGLKGVKFHPGMQNFHCNDEEMNAIAKKCEDLDIPVIIHSYFPDDTSEYDRLYTLVADNQHTKFVLAHMGGHAFLDCYRYVQSSTKNVYFDVSSIAVMFRRSPYTEHIAWLIQKIGADRVMFGSNYPMYQLVDALAAFDDLGLPFEESQQILGKTAAELLKL